MIWIYIAPPAALIVGFYAGIIFERVAWNKLIKSGRINKPNSARGG
jgi:branched-subunit amino acid ABC-type transport system permease component